MNTLHTLPVNSQKFVGDIGTASCNICMTASVISGNSSGKKGHNDCITTLSAYTMMDVVR